MKAENNKILKEKKNWILLLFKKLAKLIFNRIFYVAVAMLVQLGWILMMVLRLAAYSRYIDIGLRLIGIVLVLWILNKEINPSYKLAWTMLILILPILGVVLYFVFGRSRIAAIMQQHFEQRIEESREYLRDRPQTRQKLEALDPSASNQSRYISDVSRFPVHENTTAEYFQVGDDMFPVLVRELKQAKKYIFIEYFIINDGVMWQTILNILEEKAQRLKTLTEDVVEASKVSSGNISLEYMDLDLSEMIQQTQGELEEKFEARNLAIVTDLPTEPAVVHVDGRRMWRVLENIYGNAAKYAMPGTRVYATLKTDDTKVRFSLKNVSEHQLNIQADELTERFIRGDISRSTEGSGLGLSIAKSLTTMQGGTFDLYLDGDLFRVDITFPRVKAKGNAGGTTEESKEKTTSGVS